MTNYWKEGAFIYDIKTNKHFTVTVPNDTTYHAQPCGIRSDTIIPSFTWEGQTTDDTPTELLGSGYVWTDPNVESMNQKRRFSLLKTSASTIFMEIQVLASVIRLNGAYHKSWKVSLTSGYDVEGANFAILDIDKTVTFATTGTESWDITFTAASLDSYFDYIKCEATGDESVYPKWKAIATYVQINPQVESQPIQM